MPRRNVDSSGSTWASVTAVELLTRAPDLHADVSAVFAALHPAWHRATGFVLRMEPRNPDALYIHDEPFSEDPRRRFSLSYNIKFGGGVKPLGNPAGREGWVNGVLTPQEVAILRRANRFMAHIVEAMGQEEEDEEEQQQRRRLLMRMMQDYMAASQGGPNADAEAEAEAEAARLAALGLQRASSSRSVSTASA